VIDTASLIKVSIVEDDDKLRNHLVALIGGADGFCCLGAHRTAESALKSIPLEKPQLVLLDLELPKKSGLQCLCELKARLPVLEVLVLTIHDDAHRIFRALEEGACGYLVKPVQPARLLEAIREARTGGSPMSSQIARLVLRTFQQHRKARRILEALTIREEEVLNKLTKGYQTKEIADLLGVSDRTIGTHLRNIYQKLHVHSQAAAVAKYLQ